MNKYLILAQELLPLVGGETNITNVFHCMTRLRFNLKDLGLANQEDIQKVKGVLGLHVESGELQVIIGPSVDDVYNEIIKMTNLEETEKIKEDLDDKKKNIFTPKGIFNAVVNTFSSCMNPLVPIFVLLGMVNIIAILIGPGFLNLVTQDMDVYKNFYWIGQAIIYFLPIFLAVTTSRTFKTNVFISLLLSFLLLYPELVTLMSSGGVYTVYGIPAASVTYSATVIPIILIIWCQSYAEKIINKIIPEVVKVILVPLVTILIMLPIALCALGPLGNYIGLLLANGIIWLRNVAGPVETMVVAAFAPFLTAFGIGRPVFFICMTTLLTTGSEFAYMPIAMVINNWVVMGVSSAFAFKSKTAARKQLGITCFLANFLGGVSEPTLFGILLPNKKTYLPAIIGGALSGLYLGIMNVGYYQFGPSNFLSPIGFIGGSNMNFIHGCIAAAIGFGATFLLMMFTYKEDKK
ncbi:MAG: PTS transporter subunit EIIC [Longicatena sp.]